MNSLTQRRFFRDNVVVGAANLVSQLQSLLLIPLVIKIAGPGLYGGYVLASSLLLLATMIFSLGIGYRYRRTLPSTDDAAGRAELFLGGVAGQTICVIAGSLLLAALFRPLAGYFVQDIGYFAPLWIPVFCVTYVLYTQAAEYFRYTHRVGVLSLAALANSFLCILLYVLIGAWGVPLSMDWLLGVQVLCNGLAAAVLWGMIFREIPWRVRGSPNDYAEDIRIGFPLVLASLSETISIVVDRYVLGVWDSAEAVGVYAPAVSIGSLILFFPRIASVVLPPLLARAADKDEAFTSRSLVRINLRLFLLFGIPAVSGLAVIAWPVLHLLTTAAIADAGRYTVPIIAAASVFYGVGTIAGGVLYVERKTQRLLIANLVVAGIKALLSIAALAAGAGLIGMACVSLFAQAVGLAILVTGISVPVAQVIGRRFLSHLIVASAGMGLVVWLASVSPIQFAHEGTRVGAAVILGIACYTAILAATIRLEKGRVNFLHDLLHREG